ncbi:hypothetical protein CBM2586_A110082 [Cupriavidus phytorum]|uniref:Uncharacterized protein n=1 Tax=Cupriavidus taiwanensis TaxID=164546 RepID=A0A375C0D6_9BURK|nr:hypothetical protein CBM2586_A110082 [Cupriavidus taiwanensis]
MWLASQSAGHIRHHACDKFMPGQVKINAKGFVEPHCLGFATNNSKALRHAQFVHGS